jgi:hypothetical protein
LLPLPPPALRILSPATYQLYVKALAGWPQTTPYSDKAFFAFSAPSAPGPASTVPTLLPTMQEVQQGTPPPFARQVLPTRGETDSSAGPKGTRRASKFCNSKPIFPSTWYPLAISPALTRTGLLRFCAYAGLFLVIVGYPFADSVDGERCFYRWILATVLVTGVMVAAVGLVERVYWNGKILWLFAPMDWGIPHLGTFQRATGPFVNPDHFANYLSMVFPLALTGAFKEPYSGSRPTEGTIRLLCGVGAFIILSAILLSLSRAAWIGTTVSVLVLCYLRAMAAWKQSEEKYEPKTAWPHLHMEIGDDRLEAPRPPRGWSNVAASGIGWAAFPVIVITVLLLVIGQQGRLQSNDRLGQTVTERDGLGARPIVWEDSLSMVRDFPLFGIGLGGWPEVFPRYQTGPWNGYYFREAHNDYLQYVTETGLIGSIALIWFLGLVARCFSASRRAYAVSPAAYERALAGAGNDGVL